MKGEHLQFQELSDYYDRDLPAGEETDNAAAHLEECAQCGDEYGRLVNCLDLVHDYGNSLNLDALFRAKTLNVYRKRRFRKRLVKTGPAVAAVLVLAAGLTVFSPTGVTDKQMVRTGTEQGAATDEVLAIINENRGRMLSMNDTFIEGEVSLKDFNVLRRKLGFRNVTYSVVSGKPAAVNPSSGTWRNLEPVGTNSDGGFSAQPDYFSAASSADAPEQVVRFKVFTR